MLTYLNDHLLRESIQENYANFIIQWTKSVVLLIITFTVQSLTLRFARCNRIITSCMGDYLIVKNPFTINSRECWLWERSVKTLILSIFIPKRMPRADTYFIAMQLCLETGALTKTLTISRKIHEIFLHFATRDLFI